MSTLRVGDPLDKNTDIGAINSAEQLARIRELSDIGEAEGAEPLVAAVRAADQRLLVPADGLHRRLPGPPDRPRGDLRAGAVGADLPHPRRGGREGQQHAVRPLRRRLDRQGLADPQDGRPAARRRGLGQHVQQVRPDQPVRRLQGVRLRPRGRPPRPGRLPEGWRPIEPSRRAQDLQALHRRGVPALGVRPLLRGQRQRRDGSSPTPPWPRARTPATRSSRPARRSRAGPARPPTTAPRSSTGSPRSWRTAARSSSQAVRQSEG